MPDKSDDLFGSITIEQERQHQASQAKPSPPPRKQGENTPVQGKRSGGKRSRGKRSGGKSILWGLIIAFLLLSYSAAGFLLVPYLIETSLPDYLENKLQVIFSSGEARFNPFNFHLDIKNLSLETNEAGKLPGRFTTIGELTVDFDLISLLRGDLVCSSMDIDRLNMHITRGQDKRYNISYLFRGKTARNQSDIIDFAELPFLFSLNNINVSNSQVVIDDTNTGKEHHIDEIELALPAISNFPFQSDSYIHPRFSAVINGSPIKLTGEAALGGTKRDGRETLLSCDLNDIDIPLYFDYLPVTLPVHISQGRANGKLQISFSPEQEKGSKLRIQFLLSTEDLGVQSRNSKLSLAVPAAKLEGSLEPFNHSLVFHSILLREPVLTSDGIISKETIANLAPLTVRPAADDPLNQIIPSISIKLLIADGGSVIIKKPEKKSPLRLWHSIQLSMKNFSNTLAVSAQAENSFRLSGEHLSSEAFFTWQGSFDNRNRPGGNLQLNNIPVSLIAPFLGKKPGDISGTADMKGLLNLTPAEQGDRPFDYSLKSTTVTVKDLNLKDQGVPWLQSPNVRCEPVSRIQGVIDLGNVFLPNSSVNINRTKLPNLFQLLSSRSSQHALHGIDFSGSIKVYDTKPSAPLLTFSNAVFQANKLEQQQLQKDNFVFTAALDNSGDIKAKGSLNITPVQINTSVALSNISPDKLFFWFSTSQTLLSSQAVLSAKGTFRYPQQEFKGELSAEKVVLVENNKPVMQAAKIQFNDFSWFKSGQLSVKQVLVDQPEFSWQRLDQNQDPVILSSEILRRLLLPEPTKGTADPDTSLSHFSVSIDSLDLTNGSLSYLDKRTVPPLTLGITGVNATLAKLQYPVAEENTNISLTGTIEDSPFRLEGNGLLLQSPPSASMVFTSQSLPLSLFSKQILQQFNDIDITNAAASISSTTKWQENAPESTSELVVNGVKPKKPGTPTATALALLTENTDSMLITLESGKKQRNTPLLSEALKVFSTSLVKATINPMLIAGNDFKDLVELQYVAFHPGTATMTGESVERLNRYGEFLAVHPLIQLTITGYADDSVDRPVILAELVQAEEKYVEEENRRLLREWQMQREIERRLNSQEEKTPGKPIQETDIPVTEADNFAPITVRPVSVSNKTLNDLAAERQQAVITYLLEELSVPVDRVNPENSQRQRIKQDGNHARALIGLSDMYRSINQPSPLP